MQFFGGSVISPSPPLPTALGNNGHMMYVFKGNRICLLYREWNRPQQDLHELMFGCSNLGVPQLPGQGCSFHSFHTNTYKLSFMESPSGIKMALIPRTAWGHGWLRPAIGVLELSQCIIQAVPLSARKTTGGFTDSTAPFLQLPHFNEAAMKKLACMASG